MNLSVLFPEFHGEDHDILPETTLLEHQGCETNVRKKKPLKFAMKTALYMHE